MHAEFSLIRLRSYRQSGTSSFGLLTLRTLYVRVRYPLCGGCRCRPMQPMGSRQLAPKGMRCKGSGGLFGEDEEISYGPGIAGEAFRRLYRKSGALVTSTGP